MSADEVLMRFCFTHFCFTVKRSGSFSSALVALCSSVWPESMPSFFMLSTNSLFESDVVQDSSCNHETTLQQK